MKLRLPAIPAALEPEIDKKCGDTQQQRDCHDPLIERHGADGKSDAVGGVAGFWGGGFDGGVETAGHGVRKILNAHNYPLFTLRVNCPVTALAMSPMCGAAK